MKKRFETAKLDRRSALGLMAGGMALSMAAICGINPALASDASDKAIAAVLNGRAAGEGAVKLDAPEIAENGNTVPIGFSVDSPMTAENYVKKVHLFADGNPTPSVASFEFTPMSGKASASTRMRLAKTQNVVAIAEMSDGSVVKASAKVKVTIGGCGG